MTVEQKAEEYIKEHSFFDEEGGVLSLDVGSKTIFEDGAEFGYNKANEWHYVKDELPEKGKYVLVYTKLENVYMARLVKDNYFINKKGGYVPTSSVIAWKEIVLPELKEIK